MRDTLGSALANTAITDTTRRTTMNPNQQNPTTMKNPMLAAGQARVVVCNRFVSMWHQWRANTLALKLQVQTERCNLLQIAEREYASSYYTDRLHDAVCRRIEIAGALEYHKAKLPHANSGTQTCRTPDSSKPNL